MTTEHSTARIRLKNKSSINSLGRKLYSNKEPMSHPRTFRGDGKAIHPGDGIVPILKEVGFKRLKVVGTGFYLTRYGLVATAKHVIEDLKALDGHTLLRSFVVHLGPDNTIVLRDIRKAHLLEQADVAVVQADNFVERYPNVALMNLRPRISGTLPAEGEQLITYAYPENDILDFTDENSVPQICGDYFQGGFLRFVSPPEHPVLQFPYFESSVELRSGASGGPVFDSLGRVVAVNCRGWDFRGGEHEGDNLSYLVPIEHFLELSVDTFMVPPNSWEAEQIPEHRKSKKLTIGELALYGHIILEA